MTKCKCKTLFITGGVYGCEVSTVLSAAGVHGHCYCCSVHSLCAIAEDVLREIYSTISKQQTNNPDGFFIIVGDFNHANLKTVLQKFYQHVNFATRGNNTLDCVYTTVPHLGYSDNISVMLIPAYRPILKLAKLVQKQIKVWPHNATSALQDCFQDTDWNMFKEAAT